MQPADDPAGDDRLDASAPDAGRAPTDRRFAALVGALCAEDPAFARRVSEAHRLTSGQIMVLVAVAATVLLGVIPLALGIHLQAVALLSIGAVGIAFLPVVAPPVVGVVLHRLRPAW